MYVLMYARLQVGVQTGVYAWYGGQRLISDVFLNTPALLRQGLSLNMELAPSAQPEPAYSGGNLPCLPSAVIAEGPSHPPSSLLSSGHQNSGVDTCLSRAFPTEPSPQLLT